MPKAKKRPPKLSPQDYMDKLSELRSKQMSPDRKDYMRTIDGRGDTHALDGGQIAASKRNQAKEYKKLYTNKPTKFEIW